MNKKQKNLTNKGFSLVDIILTPGATKSTDLLELVNRAMFLL